MSEQRGRKTELDSIYALLSMRVMCALLDHWKLTPIFICEAGYCRPRRCILRQRECTGKCTLWRLAKRPQRIPVELVEAAKPTYQGGIKHHQSRVGVVVKDVQHACFRTLCACAGPELLPIPRSALPKVVRFS